jgi:putative transposase
MGKTKFVPTEGRTLQAFQFALDLTDDQAVSVARHFGARRKTYNWTVAAIKADIEAYNAHGVESEPPSFIGLRNLWNAEKSSLCVNAETGETWWREVSKEAFATGVADAVDAYWRWQKSRAGKLKGRRVGFPKFKKRGRDTDRYRITTGVIQFVDRRHLKLPKLGVVRLHENARRLERLITLGRARIIAVTIRRTGNRILASLRVEVVRPQTHHRPTQPDSVVGVDVGVRTLATVASPDGTVLERVPNPTVLAKHLGELRRLNRRRSRQTRGSSRYKETNQQISALHTHIRNARQHHIHNLTTRLAKTHGTIVVEGLNAAAMLQQSGLNGARARRRGLADAAIAEPRRQLRYKTRWYGSTLIEANRWFPSSKTCHHCDHIQDIGWAETWMCDNCGMSHHRDDNAAINLARWQPPTSDLGAVVSPGETVSLPSDTPRGAGGEDPRKSQHGTTPRGVRAA